jgi:hypothetical protein
VDTWVIVLIVVAVVVLLALLALALSRRSGAAKVRKREQAREHLQEAQVLSARAERDQALAEEQAARARRERAEVEERTAVAEREARERAAQAGEHASEAERLRAQAEKLAPGVAADGRRDTTTGVPAQDWQQTQQTTTPYPEQPSCGGATRR